MVDIGGILSGSAALIGSIGNTIFSGLNYSSEKEKNKKETSYHEGQASQLFDTLAEVDLGLHDTYMDAYRATLHNDDWKARISKQDMLTLMTMDREDNAIQRKVADAEKAGVNAFYALGGTGAQASTYTSQTQTPNLVAPKLQQVGDFAALADILSNVNIKSEQAKLINAQTRKTLAEENKINVDALVSGETLNLTKEQGNKLRAEIEGIKAQIKVDEAQYQKFMEEVAIIQYDLLKSFELDIRYKDQLTALNFGVNKLDHLASKITTSDSDKNMLMGAVAGLLGATFVGRGLKIGKLLAPFVKKYGKKGYDKMKDVIKQKYDNTFKKDPIKGSQSSDFFG